MTQARPQPSAGSCPRQTSLTAAASQRAQQAALGSGRWRRITPALRSRAALARLSQTPVTASASLQAGGHQTLGPWQRRWGVAKYMDIVLHCAQQLLLHHAAACQLPLSCRSAAAQLCICCPVVAHHCHPTGTAEAILMARCCMRSMCWERLRLCC